MKKLFITLLLLLTVCTPTFAEYKPIPLNMSKQYKTEIEHIIDSEYDQIIKKIDNLVFESKNLHDKIIQNGFNINDYINLTLISEVCIPAADLDLYAHLMKVTQEKYLGLKYDPLGTDTPNPMYEYLYPYMKDNNVNESKLTKIILYESKQIKAVKKYIKQVEKYRP